MENQVNDDGYCRYCREILNGRSDKRFCNVRHKNAFHNRRRKQENEVYREVDNQLHINHRVLKRFFPLSKGEIFIDEKTLIRAGFDSRYITGMLENVRNGERLYMVYNFGFVTNIKTHQIKIYNDD